MAYAVTCDEVRKRLRTISDIECSDEVLESSAFIPACQAMVEQALSIKGMTIDSLNEPQKNIVKAAIIALTSARVVSSAPTRESDTGVVRIRPVPSEEKDIIVKQLHEEAWECLGMLGIPRYDVYFSSIGFSDCLPNDDSFASNLEDDFSLWT